MKRNIIISAFLTILLSTLTLTADTASDILEETGIHGGLVVHIGCTDGKLTAALRKNDMYLVHGLSTDAKCVTRAREQVQSTGLYGPVSIDLFDGKKLPYVRDLVNLVVATDLGDVTMDEVLRVLAPEGVAYIQNGKKWQKTVKPRPSDIDEWTHFLHDASNSAVADDKQVGPPKRLRWISGPKWCRSHEFPSSVNAVVTQGGRIFTIFDEAPVGVFEKLPQKCMLTARDAFSGVLLWKQPMRQWQPEDGTGNGNRWNIHHTIPRRLIAVNNKVYVTFSFLNSPVSVLDAVTGEILTDALDGTKGTDEMILSDNILIVKITKERSVGAMSKFKADTPKETLAAIDLKTGKQLWRRENERVLPYAFSAAGGKITYHNMEEVVCLDMKSGKDIWRAPNETGLAGAGINNIVISGDVVLFYGNKKIPAPAPKPNAKKTNSKKKPRKPSTPIYLTAFSMKDGKELWNCRSRMAWAGACTQPADLFVIDGIVYCGTFEGKDLKTGEVKNKITIDQLISPGHHYRCHRSKATTRYMILPKRGAEFVDVEGDNHMRNDWLRAPCFTGITPANGLFYVPTDQCFCYPGVKVNGYFALSSEPTKAVKPATDAAIERGPAFGKTAKMKMSGDDWPIYRHDGKRSGSTGTKISTDLKKKWDIKLGSTGTPPVIVGDQVYVAEKDAHRIHCLDAKKGKDVWSFTAGGRIDSAPTIHDGMVIFGCRDGYVYCLKADDGELVWRFRAAPNDSRLVSYNQVESVWPVHGSVLIQEGTAYFVAGRSSYLDGGVVIYGLDAKTAKVLYSHVIEETWPDIKKDVGTPFAMEGALNDIMVSDGKDLYMQRFKFDSKLNPIDTTRDSSLGELDMGANHLVATGGFMDDTGYDRIYWMYGKRWPGFYFAQQSPKAGQIIVFDENTTYAVKYFYRRHQWSPLFVPGEQGYLMFADDNNNEPGFLDKNAAEGGMLQWLPKETMKDSHRKGGKGVEKGTGYVRYKPEKWMSLVPLRVRAMVKAGDVILTAGPPDVVDTNDPLAAFEGRKGGLLNLYKASDGSLIKSTQLKSEPAFDGMAAANGKIYISMQDGTVECWE